MKHLLLTTIAAVVLVGCGESQSPEPPTAEAPDISIHEAAENGNIEAVKEHLAAGTDVEAWDDVNEQTPLHLAAFGGRKEIVELLISKGADVNSRTMWNPKHKTGWTPLLYAVDHGHKEVAELLIAKGADVNAKVDVGGTPLHFAAALDHKEIVELLIAEGADVNGKSRRETPLDTAFQFGHKETADLLRKHGGTTGEEIKAVLDAAKTGNIESIKQYLASGADVNAEVGDGLTLLFIPAFGGHTEITELIIAEGADVNAKDKIGMTPLHGAVVLDRKETVELLIANGAAVNAKTVKRETPLDWAVPNGEIANLLRSHGGKTGKGY